MVEDIHGEITFVQNCFPETGHRLRICIRTFTELALHAGLDTGLHLDRCRRVTIHSSRRLQFDGPALEVAEAFELDLDANIRRFRLHRSALQRRVLRLTARSTFPGLTLTMLVPASIRESFIQIGDRLAGQTRNRSVTDKEEQLHCFFKFLISMNRILQRLTRNDWPMIGKQHCLVSTGKLTNRISKLSISGPIIGHKRQSADPHHLVRGERRKHIRRVLMAEA